LKKQSRKWKGDLKKKMDKKLHFVGIGGSGISGVASLAEKMGYSVTGCDLETGGHSVDHIKNVDLVIVTPAVFYQSNNHPEILEAKKTKRLMTWEEFLGKILLKDKKLICIAGTHGKSTTTAMAGKLLIDNGFDPVVVVGANVPEWGGNSRFGKGEYAVVEADEFNNNFLNYHPDIAIINNIEFDHPDFFKNEEEVQESFKKFTGNLKGKKILITEKDSLNKKFNLKILGKHNQKNANMVFLLGKTLGIGEDKIIKSIESFTGIGRRLELIADRGGIKVYDDYAHHPTAIAATLEAVREAYPNSRIWAIDEPHGFARTKALLENYGKVFDNADKVLIGPIFKARDKEDLGMSPSSIVKSSDHKDAKGFDSFDEIKQLLSKELKFGDIVLVMGAGKSYLWAREITNLLPVRFSDLTTFKIGGDIKKYFEVKNIEGIQNAVEYAKKNNLPIFIIGGGSDILVSDKEYNGVVIKYIGNNIEFNNDGTVIAEAGVNWDKLVDESVNKGFQGLECLSGIPGTVGAAPIQNIGAYGSELKETFLSLEAYSIEDGKFIFFDKEKCDFGYRESIFKRKDYWQKYIICKVTFKLSKYTDTDLTLQNIREEILRVRSEKLENPKEVGNAGSFFKNPIIDSNKKEKLETEHKDISIHPFENRFKVSAAWLIENVGWKGKTYKTAAVSSKHALILINKDDKAKPQDIYELSEKIISDVFDKFGIKLEREVQLVNF
jgi:UDP-N-acetylmuramate--alanine ligase